MALTPQKTSLCGVLTPSPVIPGALHPPWSWRWTWGGWRTTCTGSTTSTSWWHAATCWSPGSSPCSTPSPSPCWPWWCTQPTSSCPSTSAWPCNSSPRFLAPSLRALCWTELGLAGLSSFVKSLLCWGLALRKTLLASPPGLWAPPEPLWEWDTAPAAAQDPSSSHFQQPHPTISTQRLPKFDQHGAPARIEEIKSEDLQQDWRADGWLVMDCQALMGWKRKQQGGELKSSFFPASEFRWSKIFPFWKEFPPHLAVWWGWQEEAALLCLSALLPSWVKIKIFSCCPHSPRQQSANQHQGKRIQSGNHILIPAGKA